MNSAKCGLVKSRMELTLALLKPDILKNPIASEEVKQLMLKNSFYFVRSKILKISCEECQRFYAIHKDKFFFRRLTSFMSSGLVSAHILARRNAISYWRKLMGPTNVYIARHEEQKSIRGKFGLTDTRNVTHGSDSAENAQKEITFFFPDFDFEFWYKNDEPQFRSGNVEFLEETFEHKIKLNENVSLKNLQ